MAKISQTPTPYPEINVLLHRLLVGVQQIIGPEFFGMYLYGSLAAGDFVETASDVDFVVVTANEVSAETIPQLRALHEQLWASDLKWASKLEGSYIRRAALRRFDPHDPPRPQVNEGEFFVAPHDTDWIIQRHILRERGVVVAGPPIKPLIDPVSPDELRGAVAGILSSWWTGILDDPAQLERHGYQLFAVPTMCRALYCFEHGEIVSKPVAAAWALDTLDTRWHPLIESARTLEADTSPATLDETVAFIRFTLNRAQEWEHR